MFSAVLLSLILGLSILSLSHKNLFVGIIALSAVSLLSALLFYYLNAPDVAITEAAVGAGLSTIAYLWVFRAVKTLEQNTHADN
ncbi:MAG TPA: DUF4040 domain-containing protein [Spirochaetia bacterium]|nr:DUF4040 domain-containing protein [Spirochaetales bacterium]HPD80346.1 DUF4040 domain-containing protein [Spirochaetales bacterium]HQK34680.1 DUF4040 domain-containing protein [Spirochaetales bacterium]HRS65127.1 DUF4040 domain-containing protein [Spirochaetia bacterium]HRV29346.1 DUF4040 domain-containing protein [Spirochaetia bacterium]